MYMYWSFPSDHFETGASWTADKIHYGLIVACATLLIYILNFCCSFRAHFSNRVTLHKQKFLRYVSKQIWLVFVGVTPPTKRDLSLLPPHYLTAEEKFWSTLNYARSSQEGMKVEERRERVVTQTRCANYFLCQPLSVSARTLDRCSQIFSPTEFESEPTEVNTIILGFSR